MIIKNCDCEYCFHKNVCFKLNRPDEVKEELEKKKFSTDLNGVDLAVCCSDFMPNMDYRNRKTK